MPTMCKKGSQVQFEFQQVCTRRVVADFQGGEITSDGGALLIREVAKHSHILSDVASCFIDYIYPINSLLELILMVIDFLHNN